MTKIMKNGKINNMDNFNKTEEELFDIFTLENKWASEHYNQLKNWIKEHDKRLFAEIESKLLRHFDNLELNDIDDSMQNWRNYKFIRNNIVDCLEEVKKILK